MEYAAELVEKAKSEGTPVVGTFNSEPILVAPTDSADWADYRFRAIQSLNESGDTEDLNALLDVKTFHRETGTIEPVNPCSEGAWSSVERAGLLKGGYDFNQAGERVWTEWCNEFGSAIWRVLSEKNPANQLAEALVNMKSFKPFLADGPLKPFLTEVAQALVRGHNQMRGTPNVVFSNGTVKDGPPKLGFNEVQKWLEGAMGTSVIGDPNLPLLILAVYQDPRSQTDRLAVYQRRLTTALWDNIIRDRFLNDQDMENIRVGIVRDRCSINFDTPKTVIDYSVVDAPYWSSISGGQIAEGSVPEELATLEDVAMQAIRFAVESGAMGTTLIKLPKTSVVITGRDSPRMACEKVIAALGPDSTEEYIREQFPHFPQIREE